MTSVHDERIDDTEDWFVRHGIPHFIDDFSASEDVWTRAVGVLTFVFFAELFLTFGPDLDGWAQFGAFVAGLTIVLSAVALLNRIRGRPPFARPNEIGIGELALFVLIPPVLALIGSHNSVASFLGVVLLNILILIAVFLIVSWGLFSMFRWGIATMWQHLGQVLQLLGRILPLMLLFSAFLFMNAEIWQVVNDLTMPLFAIVLGGLIIIGLVFLIGAMRGALDDLAWFESWGEVAEELDDTPLEGFDPTSFDGRPKRVPLGRAARANLTLRLVVGLEAQVILVSLLIFAFYVIFGLLTVRADTVEQWTTVSSIADVELASFTLAGEPIVLTRLHLIAAGFVASFSALQFAVSLVTDRSYREQFVDGSNAEVREALAVRAVYLRLVAASR